MVKNIKYFKTSQSRFLRFIKFKFFFFEVIVFIRLFTNGDFISPYY